MRNMAKRFIAVLAATALLGGVFVPTGIAGGYGYNRVTATDLQVRKSPQGVYYGMLHSGDHFNVQYISPNGWGWGFAYGAVNKCSWTDVSYLITSPGDPHGTPPDCGPHHEIP